MSSEESEVECRDMAFEVNLRSARTLCKLKEDLRVVNSGKQSSVVREVCLRGTAAYTRYVMHLLALVMC